MKKYLQILPIAAIALAAVSCDSKSELAENISGTWSGAPEVITNTEADHATVVSIIDFERTPGKPGGQLIMSGLLNVSSTLPENQEIVQPISYSASGVATIRGEWTAHDDDEVLVYLDPTTLSVQVDPEAVQLNYNILTENSAPDTTTLRPNVIAKVKQEMTLAVQKRFFKINKIDDIKIKDNMMSCEINDRDLTMRRQTID